MKYSVVLLAAGKGSRTELGYNKMFYTFHDQEILLQKTMKTFLEDSDCIQMILVTTEEDKKVIEAICQDERIGFTIGGATRQDSVYNGLQKVSAKYVMIHDGARCFLSKEEINRCKETLKEEDACLLMVPVIDTIKNVIDGYVINTPHRDELYAAQTPQCFKTELIKHCYEQGKQEKSLVSDDASLVERYSSTKVKVVLGEYTNKKVTTKADLY